VHIVSRTTVRNALKSNRADIDSSNSSETSSPPSEVHLAIRAEHSTRYPHISVVSISTQTADQKKKTRQAEVCSERDLSRTCRMLGTQF